MCIIVIAWRKRTKRAKSENKVIIGILKGIALSRKKMRNPKISDFSFFINIRAILANLYYSVTTKTSDTNVNKYKSKAPTQTNITSYLQRSKLIT